MALVVDINPPRRLSGMARAREGGRRPPRRCTPTPGGSAGPAEAFSSGDNWRRRRICSACSLTGIDAGARSTADEALNVPMQLFTAGESGRPSSLTANAHRSWLAAPAPIRQTALRLQPERIPGARFDDLLREGRDPFQFHYRWSTVDDDARRLRRHSGPPAASSWMRAAANRLGRYAGRSATTRRDASDVHQLPSARRRPLCSRGCCFPARPVSRIVIETSVRANGEGRARSGQTRSGGSRASCWYATRVAYCVVTVSRSDNRLVPPGLPSVRGNWRLRQVRRRLRDDVVRRSRGCSRQNLSGTRGGFAGSRTAAARPGLV